MNMHFRCDVARKTHCRRSKAMRWTLCVGTLWVFFVFAVNAPVAHAEEEDETEWSAQLRWGMEYDDNPNRVQAHDGSGSPAMRYLAGGDLLTDVGDSGRLSATLYHGGTFFYRESDANTVLNEVTGQGIWWLAERFSSQILLDLKDRTERQSRRDYTRGGAALRLSASPGPLQLWVDGGWRFMAFKPSPEAGYSGPQFRTGLRWLARKDLAIDVSWGRSRRSFDTRALKRDDDLITLSPDTWRSDRFDILRLTARYQRRVHAQLRVQHLQNSSNSYGQRMRRRGVEASLTTPTVWDIFFSTRAEVQRTDYEDPVRIDDTFMIDDDHRNTVVAAFNRRIADPWEIELRYSLYTQEFGIGDEFRRQTLGVILGVHLDDSD